MSPRRPHVDKPGWLSHFIPVLAAVLTIAVPGGIYFAVSQGATQQRLVDHDTKFADQANSLANIQSKLQDIKKADDEARSKIRDEFLKRSEETAKGIAELNTKAAVQETRLGQVVETLKTISGQLDTALRPAHPPEQRR